MVHGVLITGHYPHLNRDRYKAICIIKNFHEMILTTNTNDLLCTVNENTAKLVIREIINVNNIVIATAARKRNA